MDPCQIVYPPVDRPKPFGDGVFVVDSGPHRAFAIPLPVRMTVMRLSNGDLVLHSPTRHVSALQRELEAIGPIRHLVAPSSGHFCFVPAWQAACPQAVVHGVPGLDRIARLRERRLGIDETLGSEPPAAWAGEIEQVIVPGAGGFREAVFFHRQSRTLVLTDLVMNLEAEKLPGWVRSGTRLAGSLAPEGKAPAHLRALVSMRRREARAAVERALAFGPERVVFAHGLPFERDGVRRLRASMRWLLGAEGRAGSEDAAANPHA